MKFLKFEIQNAPTNAPVTIIIRVMENQFSEAKLYTTKSNGKSVIIPGKRWYVYYYFRNPATGKMEKFCDSCKINKIKNVAERLKAGKAWVKAYNLLLQSGFNPFTPDGIPLKNNSFDIENFTVLQAIDYAIENKAGELKPNTLSDYKTRVGVFVQWLKENSLDQMNIRDLKDVHVIAFMNYLTNPNGRNIGKTSQDNYKRCLSSIFGKLKKDKIITANIVDYQTEKDEPIKNNPFTPEEIKTIKDYLLKNDVKLYRFICFVLYEFLRPVEVVRLQWMNINLEQKTLFIETKTSRKKQKTIIEPILDYLQKEFTEKQPNKESHLFTSTDDYYFWNATEKQKTDHFNWRFRKVKKELGFGKEYGIYSFRHSAALDLYHTFVKNGKTHAEAVSQLMPIIGHSNENTTEKYLRDINALLPKDYGKFYTLEF